MFSTRVARLIAGKAGYAVSCLVAAVLLVVSGYAHKAVADLSALGDGITIGGSSSVGAMNILVMGLESRTDFQGQCLSSRLLTAMHAGNVASCKDQTVGSQDTDTLILVHIFAGGQKAVGFSMPRDDLVTYPKAYYDGDHHREDRPGLLLRVRHLAELDLRHVMSTAERYLKANQAGAGGRDRHRPGGHRRAHRPLRGDEPGRVLHAGPGLRRHRGVRDADDGERDRDANLYDNASGWNAVADGYNLKKGGSSTCTWRRTRRSRTSGTVTACPTPT